MGFGKVKRFAGYGIHVGNLKESVDYYRDLLGCELIAEQQGVDEAGLFGCGRVEVATSRFSLPGCDAYLELIDIKHPDKRRRDMSNANSGTTHVCWYVDDLGSTWRSLEAAGVRSVSKSVVEVPNGPMEGGKAIYLKDPDEVRVELLEGNVYLDSSSRVNGHLLRPRYVTEFSHVGVHVSDLAASLPFYRDVLGLELFAEWVIAEKYVRDVVGYPEATLNMAVFRLPGTLAYLEVIEYQGVAKKSLDADFLTKGASKLVFEVDSVEEFRRRCAERGVRVSAPVVAPVSGEEAMCFVGDPDGFLIQVGEGGRTHGLGARAFDPS